MIFTANEYQGLMPVEIANLQRLRLYCARWGMNW